MTHRITTIAILIFLMSTVNGWAQQKKSEKYQLAVTFEQQGDFRNAARLFQELYSEQPDQIQYFQGVARSLGSLQRYLELLPLVEIELGKRQSIDLYCLASITAKKSNQQQKSQQYYQLALESVNRLSNDFEIDNAIRLIAKSQSDINAYENAVQTYSKGRELLRNIQNAYADELSMLYVQMGNVQLGMREITNHFRQQQQYGIIQGRIAALLIDQNAISIIDEELSSLSKNDYAFSKVYVWFLRETKRFDRAFQQSMNIDNGLGLQGREILEFADITLKDGQYDIAMKAFGNILDRGKNNPHFPAALYGYAKAMDQRLHMSEQKGAIPESEVMIIINRYKDIVAQSPNGQFASECLYRIGTLTLQYLNDPDAAKDIFLTIMNQYKQFPISAAAANQVIDISIATNELTYASELAQQSMSTYQYLNQEEADKSKFLFAQLLLYNGFIDSTKAILIGLAGKTDSDISNDALELSLFLEQFKQYQGALVSWGKVLLLQKQHKYDDAIQILRSIITQMKGTDISEYAQYTLCDILSRHDSTLAIQEADIFLREYPESVHTDFILFMMAGLHIQHKQNQRAIDILTDILVRFPQSLYARKSRELIRVLRGDS